MRPSLLILMLAALATAGCASRGDELPPTNPFQPEVDERRLARADARQIYNSARSALESADYATAKSLYARLDASYPFTAEATQGQMEGIYARFRAFETEAAIAAADRFLRAHPRHPHVDYVLYLRGLIHFEASATDILDRFNIDASGRDPVDARRAFEEFGRLLRNYPDSVYAADARRRMLWLRERIALHHFNIADYYRGRGACVAAVRRGLEILELFRDTRQALPTLALMEDCYTELGLEEQAADMRLLIATNASQPEPPAAPQAAGALAEPPALN